MFYRDGLHTSLFHSTSFTYTALTRLRFDALFWCNQNADSDFLPQLKHLALHLYQWIQDEGEVQELFVYDRQDGTNVDIFRLEKKLGTMIGSEAPPAPPLVGIELNPGPPSSMQVTPSHLFSDGLLLIYDCLSNSDWLASSRVSHHWYTVTCSGAARGGSANHRCLTLSQFTPDTIPDLTTGINSPLRRYLTSLTLDSMYELTKSHGWTSAFQLITTSYSYLYHLTLDQLPLDVDLTSLMKFSSLTSLSLYHYVPQLLQLYARSKGVDRKKRIAQVQVHMSVLTSIPSLTQLSFGRSEHDARELLQFLSIKKIQFLTVRSFDLTVFDLDNFRDDLAILHTVVPNLTHLAPHGFGWVNQRHLQLFTSLTSLTFPPSQAGQSGFELFANLIRNENSEEEGRKWTDSLRQCSTLTKLTFIGCSFTKHVWQRLFAPPSSSLTSLSFEMDITNYPFSLLENLTEEHIDETTGVEYRPCEQVRHLQVIGLSYGADGMKQQLRYFRELRSLTIVLEKGHHIDPHLLDDPSSMPLLERLDLSGSSFLPDSPRWKFHYDREKQHLNDTYRRRKTEQQQPSIHEPPASRLVGIELNPGPTSSSSL